MIWVDREVKKIKERGVYPEGSSRGEWVDDMKTPSGRIHVGSLRGVVIHDLVHKVLLENKVKSHFTYVFDDHDPMDAIPSYLDFSKWEKYAGMQLYKIPSPQAGYKSYAEYYAKEFLEVFNSIDCHPEIIWSSELYNSGKMNGVISQVLDAASKIREIYQKITKAAKPADWYPFNVVCEKCQKVGTTTVHKWDGEFVHYRCHQRMVDWAQGCGYEGKISPFNGNGKFPWKVDWPAKWKVIGITIEGAGKDHMSSGGSHDMADAVCKQVLNYPTPYAIPYEWFIIGGKKMSSSKGIGSSAKEVSEILPPNVLRFLIVRTPIGTALDFNPYGDTILNLFDDYDRCLNAYFDKQENKLADGKQGEVTLDFARIAELSKVKPLPKKRIFLGRFRTMVNLLKGKKDVVSFFKTQKKSALTDEEKQLIEERIKYAKIYMKSYEEKTDQPQTQTGKFVLNDLQIKFLETLTKHLNKTKSTDRDKIQEIIFSSIKEAGIKPKEAFTAFYHVLTGKPYGPKAADLIIDMGLEKIIKNLKP